VVCLKFLCPLLGVFSVGLGFLHTLHILYLLKPGTGHIPHVLKGFSLSGFYRLLFGLGRDSGIGGGIPGVSLRQTDGFFR